MSTRVLKILIILLIPLLTIITAVRVLTTDQYLAYEYNKASFPSDTFGFSKQQRYELASSNLHYVRAHLPVDALSNQVLNGKAVYNPREVSHMADVRRVFQSIFRVWQIELILLSLMAFILWQTGEKRALGSALQWGGLLTCSLITCIGLLAIFAWQYWFSTFHLFFFEPGSWLFSYSDTLIRLFPVEFWFDATSTISILSLLGGLTVTLLGCQMKRLWA